MTSFDPPNSSCISLNAPDGNELANVAQKQILNRSEVESARLSSSQQEQTIRTKKLET